MELAHKREQDDPLAALATLTRVMPAQAWVQRYAWNGEEMEISGYRREGADVIGALRKSGAYPRVQLGGTEAVAELPTGQPFNVTLSLREGDQP